MGRCSPVGVSPGLSLPPPAALVGGEIRALPALEAAAALAHSSYGQSWDNFPVFPTALWCTFLWVGGVVRETESTGKRPVSRRVSPCFDKNSLQKLFATLFAFFLGQPTVGTILKKNTANAPSRKSAGTLFFRFSKTALVSIELTFPPPHDFLMFSQP